MKFKITLKDPDGFFEGISMHADDLLEVLKWSPKVNQAAKEAHIEEIKEFISKWVEYDEYVTIEFDTVAGTARVVPSEEV